uniref:SmORF n=2 Tax=Babesia bovis TaxID=5865 RepID=A7AR29_BABBO|eukprot:XP_001610566.1 SmORF [Babesia bovis T2Bo]
MVNVNRLPKLCVVVALGLSATATSTDVAQEQPRKESFLSRFLGKKGEPTTKHHEAPVHTETAHLLMFPLEWYLLPYPINRKYLLKALPSNLAAKVPEDCNEPIKPEFQQLVILLPTNFTKIVSLNTLWKLSVLVAFGVSTTATATDVAQEQPKKEELENGSLRNKEKPGTKPVEVKEATRITTKRNSDPNDPPMFSVEWYLLPKPLNRASLRERLPWFAQNTVPRDCNQPIAPPTEKYIRNHFSWVEKQKQKESSSADATTTNVSQPKKGSFLSRFFSKNNKQVDIPDLPKYSLEWYFLPKEESRKHLRDRLPYASKGVVASDCRESIAPVFEKRIRDYLSLYTVDWYLLPKPENRATLRNSLPKDLVEKVPEDCMEHIEPEVEDYIRKYFLWYCFEWYLLPKPENRAALRNSLPEDLAAKVPEDCNEPISPDVEELIREHFTVIEKKQRPNRFWYLHL